MPGSLPGLGAWGKGQVIFLSLSGQNGWILSYWYHCLSPERPLGGTTDGSSFGSGDQGGVDLIRSVFSSSVSSCSVMNTAPGWEASHPKWWYFLMLATFLKCGVEKSVQSYVETIAPPFSSLTSCAELQSAESLTACAIAFKLPTFVRR